MGFVVGRVTLGQVSATLEGVSGHSVLEPNFDLCSLRIQVRSQLARHFLLLLVKKVGKVFPLQAWTDPWGSGRLRLPDFLDFRHYEGGKVVTLTQRPFLPPGVFLVLIFRG